KTLGGPWRSDEKAAATAAWLMIQLGAPRRHPAAPLKRRPTHPRRSLPGSDPVGLPDEPSPRHLPPHPDGHPQDRTEEHADAHDRADARREVRIHRERDSAEQLRPALLLPAIDEQDEPDAARDER